ncbi:MAG: sugar nucleotide-binding protein, partial [Gammaproteobacteria bacterium]|nr:sugar nucleotide-binding protein [Gammaproteobacteria bacterium]
MKVLITGADGQLVWELQRIVSADIELVAIDITELDITKPEQVNQFIEKEKPDWVINAAAYTAVDKVEEESELAHRVNFDGAQNIAKACKTSGAKMLQVSTDFVFDGKQSSPYLTTSKPNPLSV